LLNGSKQLVGELRYRVVFSGRHLDIGYYRDEDLVETTKATVGHNSQPRLFAGMNVGRVTELFLQ